MRSTDKSAMGVVLWKSKTSKAKEVWESEEGRWKTEIYGKLCEIFTLLEFFFLKRQNWFEVSCSQKDKTNMDVIGFSPLL